MFRFYQQLLTITFCFILAIAAPSFAVKEMRVSQHDGGHQVWFQAEDFDERSPNENYKLGDAEGALKPIKGAFGDIVTNTGGNGWLLYRFDISFAGGKGGDWRFIGRIINPSNASDWLWILGADGDKIPEVAPAFVRPDDIIFENNTPDWAWVRDGDFGLDGGTINELQDGENVMMIWTRGSNLTDQYDVFMWADDIEYQPTDEDFENAKLAKLAVQPNHRLTTTWAKLKSE
ncbi:MAG: hypothetical protein ACE1ZS_04705 [Candidatus Poribacteria bacterium]